MNGIKSYSYIRLTLKGKVMNSKDKIEKTAFKESLLKLDKRQLKLFYGMLVYYWVNHKFFISKQNFFNLWCELNELCHDIDESFPEPYDDRELLRSYCHAHPYYFIDILAPELVINLFCEYLDNRLNTLIMIVNKLYTEGLRAAYECSNMALELSENIDELVSEAEEHLKAFS